MANIRTFIALPVSSDVRSRAAELIQRLRSSQANVKWVAPQNMHLTLKFLGEVPDARVPQICQVVSSCVEQTEPFEITFCGAGAFPSAERPRTIWLGVSQGQETVEAVQTALEEGLHPLGFRREHRRFHPHLTLGRVRRGSGRALSELIHQCHDFPAASTRVSELIVFASFLDRSGPTYEVLSRAPLSG